MDVAIIHYHLNPGGVTRIIESQVYGLHKVDDTVDITIYCGQKPDDTRIGNVSIRTNELLHYSPSIQTDAQMMLSSQKIIRFLKKKNSKSDILHCHNPNLGKNPSLTNAIYQLACEGWKIINHVHDFAADRPQNLDLLAQKIPGVFGLKLHTVLYPDLPNYHYIILNSFDYQRILNENIPKSRIHLLYNPVIDNKYIATNDRFKLKHEICKSLNLDASKKICTYPVRIIRRKNFGEFVLLAALFSKEAEWLVTQPPKNPFEIPFYLQWRAFCDRNGIAVKFDAGKMVDFEKLIAASDFCITTSTREGFGMAYVEPWISGTPVIGRNLPNVTDDLKKTGIRLPRLYDKLIVDGPKKQDDFKDFDQNEQEQIIESYLCKTNEKNRLFRNNPILETLFDPMSDEIINHNRLLIQNQFTPEKYGERLFEIYRGIPG